MRCRAVVLFAGLALLSPALASAGDVRGGCYAEDDHFRCLDYPYQPDYSIRDPVAPPTGDLGGPGEPSLDMTGRPQFDAPFRNLRPEMGASGAQSSAATRGDRYNPLPDRDGGYYYPGTRVYPGSPLFGRAGRAGAFGLQRD